MENKNKAKLIIVCIIFWFLILLGVLGYSIYEVYDDKTEWIPGIVFTGIGLFVSLLILENEFNYIKILYNTDEKSDNINKNKKNKYYM